MVLKVVRGKILETLKLRRFSAACDWFLEARVEGGAGSKWFAFIKMGLGDPDWNRAEGLRSTIKKLLVSAQNLENKGPEIFLPPRSMVLKIVRGKILETLELASFRAARGSVLAPRAGVPRSDSAGERPRRRVPCQVVKDR
jgi:hypothetical protein